MWRATNAMWFITILISLVAIFMGSIVLLRNNKARENRYFFTLNLLISIWVICNFASGYVEGFWIRLAVNLDFSLAVILPFVLMLFAGVFTDGFQRKKLLLTLNSICILLATIMAALVFMTGTIVSRIEVAKSGVNVIMGQFFWLYAAVLIIPLIVSMVSFVRGYMRSNKLKKTQIKIVAFGLVAAATILIMTNLLLPRVIKSVAFATMVQESGYLGIIIFLGFTTYAIVKHKMMDIRMVVARSVAYAVLLLVLGGFYSGVIVLAQSFIFPDVSNSPGYIVLQIILALIMAFTFQPLRRWITKATDKIFFKNQYDPEELLDLLAHTIGSTIILIELLYKALDLLMKKMKISRGIVVVLTDTGSIYTSHSSGYKVVPEIKEEDMLKFAKDGVQVYDELEESSRVKHLLRKYDCSIAIPLKTDNDTEGILLLGEKLSGDMYSAADLQVFEIIAPELAVAINNAKSFEKIEKFNVTLRGEVKKATSELEKKNEQLMELDKAKDEFISMASHQLRTPLTAIKGYLSMLLEGDAGEIKVSQYDFVNEAFNGANRMVGLINDLLNVSRMETGRFFLEPTEVDMDKVVQEEVKQLQNHAKEKKLVLKYVCKGKIPKMFVDETKIRQVMMNFIDNAVYYTTKGSVTVTLRKEGKDVVFEVVDTGIGVPKNQQKNLFTKFYRADNARHVRPDGTGLGIYLAKRVMDDHHGQLIFHSVEGKGSTFGFRLPLKTHFSAKQLTPPAPLPNTAPVSPGIGELAAGVGVSAQTLQATSEESEKKAKEADAKKDEVKAAEKAGIEKPLPDSTASGVLAADVRKEEKVVKQAVAKVHDNDTIETAAAEVKEDLPSIKEVKKSKTAEVDTLTASAKEAVEAVQKEK